MKHLILYVNSMKPSGGIERVVATLAARLSGICRVTVLVKDEPETSYALPPHVALVSLGCPLQLAMELSRLRRAANLLRHLLYAPRKLRQAADNLHADYLYVTTPYACLEAWLARIPRAKVIISEHGARGNFNRCYRLLKRLLYRKYPVHVVPTQTDYEWYEARRFPSVCIPHFRSPLPYEQSRQTENVVLNIGRLTDDKQQLLLLNMWRQALRQEGIAGWKLRIVGQGENYQKLWDYIQANQLSPVVELLPPTPNVEQFYRSASVYASSSRSEGFPMVLVEAISFGLPTIAFDCPTGPGEILNDGAGVLVPLNDEKAFIENLIALLSSKALRQQYSDKAFERSASWGDDKILEKWKAILI